MICLTGVLLYTGERCACVVQCLRQFKKIIINSLDQKRKLQKENIENFIVVFCR